jgi:hypothetical protein
MSHNTTFPTSLHPNKVGVGAGTAVPKGCHFDSGPVAQFLERRFGPMGQRETEAEVGGVEVDGVEVDGVEIGGAKVEETGGPETDGAADGAADGLDLDSALLCMAIEQIAVLLYCETPGRCIYVCICICMYMY